eukprot:CAMPEP_0113864244 /NCGR_PEP_ID=MMETSP0372-20130328/17125_1 /TAXON_ID=340204 /ORGANISM="Lankesteria abbotti" /LENGTH=310 /DNA_ID=CAMNT_0000847217 /DNA_START=131 /DNA_END=1060 /DNA_ORIENTATION=- /assembly_acc=CAM_ASM_000359
MGKDANRRKGFFDRVIRFVEMYPKILVVHADNVGSRQMADIRFELRGKAILLMGKNTMIRTALKGLAERMPQVANLIPEIRLNMGLVFCISDPNEVRSIILANKVPSAARQGLIAPVDVVVPSGATGLDPSQTSFFQALQISTKIVKGQIEIQSPVQLINVGDKVTASQSTLLQKLNIRPFAYGLITKKVYDDGSVYDAAVLDMTDDDVVARMRKAVQNVAALSRAVGMPNQASISHSLVEVFKNCAALCIEAGDYDFPEMENLRKFVEDPSAFASAAPVAVAVADAPAVKEAEPEEESEEEEDMGFSLF